MHRDTIGKFLREIYPAKERGKRIHYPVDVGLQLLKQWLNIWIRKKSFLEKKFHPIEYTVKALGSKKDLRAALGTELLYWLQYKEGDEAHRARAIITKALPGSVAPEPDFLLNFLQS